MLFALPFPAIDPIAIAVGPFAIRWYALAYIAGLVLGWRTVRLLTRKAQGPVSEIQADDFLVWATLGVVLGGRLGYVLFYKPLYYLSYPEEIFFVWQGGMSFHGGLLGVILAMVLFARKHKLPFFALADIIACATPIGLFFGRIANFINGELFGRIAPDVAWAFVFPRGGDIPRHPSQLYEAGLEGVLLFLVLAGLAQSELPRKRFGLLSGVFLTGYALARMVSEFFREPDAHIGFLALGTTMGQILSVPMLAYGLWLIVQARKLNRGK